MTYIDVLSLLGMASLNFIQSGISTWYVRAATSADVMYHRLIGYVYNVLWCVSNGWFFASFITYLQSDNFVLVALAIILYSTARAEGAALSQKMLLKFEKGEKRVGAKKNGN